MSISMYDATVPVLTRTLTAFQAVLDKAKAHAAAKGTDEANYMAMRIVPDMLPFPAQIRVACDIAKRGVARLADIEAPVYADDEASFDDLKARCQKTIDFLKTVTPEQVDGSADKDIVLQTPMGDFPFKGRDYVFGFILANVHFHFATAYGMLRGAGVELGKADYLGAR